MSGTLYVPLKADYYEDPKVIRAGEAAELLYVHMLAYCSRTFTDGFIDDAQMTRLGLKRIEKRAATLAQLALITRVDDGSSHGYRVSSWLKHNPSVREIVKAHEKQSSEGKRGNHQRWHAGQGIVVEGCPWCKSTDSEPASDRDPDRGPDDSLSASASGHPIGPESQDTESATDSSSSTATAPDPIPADNPQEDDPREAVVVGLLAKRATDKAGKIGTTRERYEKGALKNIVAERGDEIRSLLRDRPSASAEQIVDLLERGSGYQPAPSSNGARPPDNPRQLVNKLCPPIVVPDIEPKASPMTPDLLARARHTEDEPIEEAVAS
jgi:hypothetical protein